MTSNNHRLNPMLMNRLLIALSIVIAACLVSLPTGAQENGKAIRFGVDDRVGTRGNPKRLTSLVITESGVYENLLIDGEWGSRDLVQIKADDVVLRNCEIRHGRRDGIDLVGKNIVIESCKIHHLLAGTYEQQADAHGITGRPNGLIVRNCEIHHVSGDCLQFDPGRNEWSDVRIEYCTLWTGPLAADAAGFRRGERPGENALDTKALAVHPRAKVTISNCHLYGWEQPAQIHNVAALNLKENIEASVTDCLFQSNEICLRLRGDTGPRGGAKVTVERCFFYDSDVAVRMEDAIADLKLARLAVGSGIGRTVHQVGQGPWPGYSIQGVYEVPRIDELQRRGFVE